MKEEAILTEIMVKPDSIHRNDEAFGQLRRNLSAWSIPPEFMDQVIERHIAVAFEKGARVLGECSTDDLIAYVPGGYIKVRCPAGDGSRTLVRPALKKWDLDPYLAVLRTREQASLVHTNGDGAQAILRQQYQHFVASTRMVAYAGR